MLDYFIKFELYLKETTEFSNKLILIEKEKNVCVQTFKDNDDKVNSYNQCFIKLIQMKKEINNIQSILIIDSYEACMQKEKVQVSFILNKIRSNEIDASLAKTKVKEISPEDIPIEMQIAKDKSNSEVNGQGLSDEFNQKYNQFQVDKLADEQSRKEYAKQFIENARKNGYHITLSDDMQVTSVKPIRKPTNQNDTESFESQPSN